MDDLDSEIARLADAGVGGLVLTDRDGRAVDAVAARLDWPLTTAS